MKKLSRYVDIFCLGKKKCNSRLVPELCLDQNSHTWISCTDRVTLEDAINDPLAEIPERGPAEMLEIYFGLLQTDAWSRGINMECPGV